MLHLYCIAPATLAVPDACTGVESQRPFAVQAGGLAIWATEHEVPVIPSIDGVRTHNAVVVAAMQPEVTPVPLRFGQAAVDRAAAAARVLEEEEKWLALLARFAGRAEYGVRVVGQMSDAEQDVHAFGRQTGTEYMAALARKQAHAADRRAKGEQIAEALAARTSDLVVDTRVDYGGGDGVLVSVAHLVAWAAADAYHGVMREVREASQDATVVLTGPWPPYSFVVE